MKSQELAPRIVLGLSILGLVGILGVILFLPKPTTRGLEKQRRDRTFDVRLLTRTAEKRLAELNAGIVNRTWTGSEETIGPAALARVNRLVQSEKLQLVSFRPQRRNDEGPLSYLPFLLTVEGPSANVARLARDLEDPATRLAVSLIQIAAADADTGRVTANIGLAAFLRERPAGAVRPGTRRGAPRPSAAPSGGARP